MNDEKRIEDWIDRISKMPIENEFDLDHILERSNIPNAILDIAAISERLIELGYADMPTIFYGTGTRQLLQVREKGGHYNYLEIMKKEKRQKEIEDANYDLTLSTLKINKYALRTRWIAIISFLISVVGLIYAIMTYYL